MRTAEYDEIQETLEEIAKENSLLKEKAKQADVLTEVLQELVGETEWDSPKTLFFSVPNAQFYHKLFNIYFY